MGSYGSQSVESIHNLLAREAQMHAETRCQALQEAENIRHPHSGDLVEQLRHRACPPEGEYLEHDHGHSDCYLEREAADEIETLREIADALDERCTKLRAENEQLRSKLVLLESHKGVRWDGPA